MKRGPDLTGRTFTRWTVLSRAPRQGSLSAWNCQCACGAERAVLQQSLVRGASRSCGCLNREELVARTLKHGHALAGAESEMYSKWKGMRRRCLDPKSKGYPYYGARGITVCERWNDFANFLADMGEMPPEHTLDRIDPDGNYEPDNCRWATYAEQTANRRPFTQEGRRGEDSNLATLTWAEVAEIRAAEGTATQRELARRYGVTQGAISMILTKRTWIGDPIIAAVGAAQPSTWGQVNG
jgi:hypothetical protein